MNEGRKMKNRRGFLKTAIFVGIGLVITAIDCHSMSGTSMDFFEVVETRRSVRQYKPDPVPQSDLIKILEAAKLAPTAGNRQPWKFVVIQQPENIARLKEETFQFRLAKIERRKTLSEEEKAVYIKDLESKQIRYFSAPVYIGVFTDSEVQNAHYNSHVGPLAAGYICLAARALGYGTVYVTESIPGSVFQKVANVPERYVPTCVIPLGIPEAWPEKPYKKPLDELVIYEKFIPGVNYHPVKAISLESEILEKYAGKYQVNSEFTVMISVVQNKIFFHFPADEPGVELYAITKTNFILKGTDVPMTFVMNKDGKVLHFVWRQGGMETIGKRIE